MRMRISPARCAVCGKRLFLVQWFFFWYPMCKHDRDEAAGLCDWIKAQTYDHKRTREEEEELAQYIVAILVQEDANKR